MDNIDHNLSERDKGNEISTLKKDFSTSLLSWNSLIAGRRRVTLRMIPRVGVGRLALQPLFEVHLRVALLLVAPCELSAALITAERFLTGVRAHVGSQVVTPRERAHADATLERLLPGVNANMPGEFVAAGEPAVAAVHWAGVGPLMDRRFARSVWVLSRLHRHQSEG